MLRHVIAPARDFTQISNEQIWNDELSDTAFRLLVRALALPPAKARATTVTELAHAAWAADGSPLTGRASSSRAPVCCTARAGAVGVGRCGRSR